MTSTAIDISATTPEGRAAVREIIRELAWDRAYDPYGSGMAALGAVVDVLWTNGEGVPSAIATGGPAGSEGMDELAAALDEGATIDDVRYFMFVLDRYLDLVKLAGRNY